MDYGMARLAQLLIFFIMSLRLLILFVALFVQKGNKNL